MIQDTEIQDTIRQGNMIQETGKHYTGYRLHVHRYTGNTGIQKYMNSRVHGNMNTWISDTRMRRDTD